MSLLHNDVDVFLSVSETQSFSISARQLGLTQSAVTKKIQRLENDLGVDLFIEVSAPLS